PSGRLHAPGDAYAQSLYILRRFEALLAEAGAELRHTVRTRGFFTDISVDAAGFARAHGKVFRGIDPVTTGVEAGLTQPGMRVEIELDAVIHDGDGRIGA
ncbi:MAG: Rid family hydrolase, partial [Pseudomonadota bacterium]